MSSPAALPPSPSRAIQTPRSGAKASSRGRRTNRVWLRSMWIAAGLSSALTAALSLWSCASVPLDTRKTVSTLPDQQIFIDHVSFYLERRCGTLDCHGQPGRPLRLYGLYSLRLPNEAGATPATQATSLAEKIANYRSVVGLEPEQLNRVMAGESVQTLLLFQKPLSFGDGLAQTLGVRHRGGPQMSGPTDPGYRCMADWLEGTFEAGSPGALGPSALACQNAATALDRPVQ